MFLVESRPPLGIGSVASPTTMPYINTRSPDLKSTSANLCLGGMACVTVQVAFPKWTTVPISSGVRATRTLLRTFPPMPKGSTGHDRSDPPVRARLADGNELQHR